MNIGDTLAIQNQMGNFPRRWDKTGVIIKFNGYDQYEIRVHGSRRITLRNRKFLRKIQPLQTHRDFIPLETQTRQKLPKQADPEPTPQGQAPEVEAYPEEQEFFTPDQSLSSSSDASFRDSYANYQGN